MIVSGLRPMTGVQCESTMCRNLLAAEGLELSEPMAFGLGSGIGFGYMERCDRKTGIHEPVTFCTPMPGEIARNLGNAIGLTLVSEETVSRKEAWTNLTRRLDNGKPYGLKLDRFYLDYLERKVHFSAHYLTAYGYDEESIHVIDVGSKEVRKPTIQNIERARAAKGFMASKNLGLYYEGGPPVAFERALRGALTKTVTDMVYGQKSFFGVKGMLKFAERLRGWRNNPNFRYQLMNHYLTWEGDGEAQGGFRRLFAGFLQETSIVLNNRELGSLAESFKMIAEDWSNIDETLKEVCMEEDGLSSRLATIAKSIKKQAVLEADAYRGIEKAIIC